MASFFHQSLLLSVDKTDPLAEYDEIPVEMPHNKSIIGRSNPYGFNDWVDEVKFENRCKFNGKIRIDNVTYFNEWAQIPRPILFGSFGIGIPRDKGYFEKRKLIRVIGKYCKREVSLFYEKHNRERLQTIVDMIVGNARRIDAIDKEIDLKYGILYPHAILDKTKVSPLVADFCFRELTLRVKFMRNDTFCGRL